MTLTDFEVSSLTLIGLAFGTVWRSLFLACLCGFAGWLLRSRTAALRFMLWKWILLSLFGMPVLIKWMPPLPRPSTVISRIEITVLPGGPTRISTEYQPVVSNPSTQKEASKAFIWLAAAPVVYLLIALALIARLAYNLSRLRLLVWRSQFIPDINIRDVSHEMWLKSGAFVKPRVAFSEDVSSPVTFESDDFWILLPPSCRHWGEPKLRAVLAHEMAHVQRGDSRTLVLASLATCLFWFHPLSWFLRRQLAVLAEEACDEIVVCNETTPERYSEFLIDFARDVKRGPGRLAFGAIAIAARSSLRRRIERLFADKSNLQHGRRAIAAVAFALFLPALYISAAARSDEPQESVISQQTGGNLWNQALALTPEGAARIASAVQANPEDQDSRLELLMFYSMHHQDQPFTAQLLWFIKHRPDTEILRFVQAMFSNGTLITENSRARLLAAWEEAITEHASSAAVLYNAAGFLEGRDPERGLALLRRAEALDPAHREKYDGAIVAIYAAGELQAITPDGQLNNIRVTSKTGAILREQLANSNNPALLAATGQFLVRMIIPERNGNLQLHRGLDLIQQAINLDAGDKKWTDALEWAQAEPQRQLNYAQLASAQAVSPGTVRIGPKVADASLIAKTDPIYPPLALRARIQGTVEFTVTVGADGNVQNIVLVHGHPVLVNAAKDAVMKYMYRPVLLSGKAVPFVTDVFVPFHLDDSTQP